MSFIFNLIFISVLSLNTFANTESQGYQSGFSSLASQLPLPKKQILVDPRQISVTDELKFVYESRIKIFDSFGRIRIIFDGSDDTISCPKNLPYRHTQINEHANKIISESLANCRYVALNGKNCGLNRIGIASETIPNCK